MDKTRTLTAVPVLPLSSRRLAFLALKALFLGVIGVVSYWKGGPPVPPVWLLPLFMLATFRLARTISFNKIGEVLRGPFTETKPDSCGAGANVHPKGDGLQYALGSLMACPICSGTWAALFLYSTWVIFPPLGQTLVLVLAFAGGSEMLHWGAEFVEWGGRMFRVVSGAVSPDEE